MTRQARTFVLAVLGLALFWPGRAWAIYDVFGTVFTASGTSGTAADSPSFASLAVYRWNYPFEMGRQSVSLNPLSSHAIFPAGGGNSAYFYSDMDSLDQWKSPEAAGQTAVAVAETRFNQFTWPGKSSVYFSKAVISGGDLNISETVFDGGRQLALPDPLVTFAGAAMVSLSWTALADDQALISSYTLYRATYLPDGTNRSYGTNEVLDTVAAPVGGAAPVSYNDNAVVQGSTYYYTLAVNFAWPGVVSASAGARPDQPFYASFGQSLTVSAQALDAFLTPTPTASFPASFSPTPSATDSLFSSFTETPSMTASPTDSPTPSVSGSPSSTFTPTLTGTDTFTATPSASASPSATATVSFSASPSPSTTATPSFSPTPSASPSVIAAVTTTPARARVLDWSGNEILAPNPVKAGETLCLYAPGEVERTLWLIYDFSGTLVSKFDSGADRPCWKTPSKIRGVFMVHLEITGQGGDRKTKVFKVAVLP